jgi:2-polyprenyl-6-methoxyphenol hydroxylase-like FAD-dependent oxidoreductase
VSSIGIVGAGSTGLHLGLFLRQHDVPVTIYTNKTAEQIESGRLMNTVAHHHHTRERERKLGVNHWDGPDFGYVCHHHYIGGEPPLVFRGDFKNPSNAVDYRIYLPRLLKDFEERGGKVVVETLAEEDLERLSEEHDFVAIAAGRGSFTDLFKPREGYTPFDRPPRALCVGLYRGIGYPEPRGVTLGVSPGAGELIEIPFYSFEGHVTVLLFENLPGGDLEVLARMRYEEDPDLFERTVLEKLEKHYPATYERVDRERFGLTGPLDLLQGGIVPTIRQDYAPLPNGKFAMAVGEAHIRSEVAVGQGANACIYEAWVLGEEIVNDIAYDRRFCERVARKRWEFAYSAWEWTNFTVSPPPPRFLNLLEAMAQNKAIADEFTDNFNHPDRQWDILATPERTEAYLKKFNMAGASV